MFTISKAQHYKSVYICYKVCQCLSVSTKTPVIFDTSTTIPEVVHGAPRLGGGGGGDRGPDVLLRQGDGGPDVLLRQVHAGGARLTTVPAPLQVLSQEHAGAWSQ